MLTEEYHGYTLTAQKDETLGGDKCVILSATRKSDGWDLYYDVNTSISSLRSGMKELRGVVDDYRKHPENYED